MPENTKFENVKFLKSYVNFVASIRDRSANLYLDTFKLSKDEALQKVCMLRIFEETISSSEDFMMWLRAIQKAKLSNSTSQDILNHMVYYNVPSGNEQLYDELYKEFKDVKKPNGLLRKLNLKSIQFLSKKTNIPEAQIEDVCKKVIEVIHSQYRNRTIKNRLLVKVQNKIKHGMVITDEGTFITVHVSRHQNKAIIRVDLNEANKLVGTIQSTTIAIISLIGLLVNLYIIQDEQAGFINSSNI